MNENASNIKQLFGFPYYIGKISQTDYEKEKIIKDIEKNYHIDKNRNKWDNHSNLHHLHDDYRNDNFTKIDFSSLKPIYEKHIYNFLNSIPSQKKFHYHWNIINYTCFGKGQFMAKHSHLPASFSAVHYVKLNSKSHKGTCYYNPVSWNCVLGQLKPLNILKDAFSTKDVINSWLHSTWEIGVQEDDFVITPGILEHGVITSTSDEIRMAIVLNIELNEE